MTTDSLLFWLLFVLTIGVSADSNLPNEFSGDKRKEKRQAVIPSTKPPSSPPHPPAYPIDSSPSKSSIQQAILAFQRQDSPITYAETIWSPQEGQEQGKGHEKGKELDNKEEPCIEEADDCVPLVYCAAFYNEVLDDNSFCKIGNVQGARCKLPRDDDRPPSAAPPANQEEDPEDLPAPPIEDTIRRFPISAAENAMANAFKVFQVQSANIEQELRKNKNVVNNPKTPEFGHLQFFRTSSQALQIGKLALSQDIAVNTLVASPIPDSDDGSVPRPSASFNAPPSGPVNCPPIPKCNFKDVYRTHDGSCNNRENPMWGKTFTPFQRLAKVHYADGISVPRKTMSGKALPSARKVSTVISPDANKPSPTYTLSVMQWGQFIDHDLTQTPITRFDDETGIQCCTPDGKQVPPPMIHPECFAITIPKNDPFYSKFGQRCMNFVRSLPAPNDVCSLGHRNQMNQLSHFLDGSEIYGSSKTQADSLRMFLNGRLKVQGGNLLPDDLTTPGSDFLAGDNRVNEQPHLMVIHTIWVRQHNLIAQQLKQLQPGWDDNKIYQEARKIVVAQTQHIVFNEWLPIVLGTDIVYANSLIPRRSGFTNSYDKNLNPSILNEFASVAFRFGHTLLQGTLQLFNSQNNQLNPPIELSNSFGQSQLVSASGQLARLLRGLVRQPMQQFDHCVVDDVTNLLFKTPTSSFGLDLVALNTQRARDHGVGSYNNILRACGFQRVKNFNQLAANMGPNVAPRFKTVYANVRDIDPFVAGISENPVSQGILGRLFNCIVREQFSRLKFGDRFYYENGGLEHSFTANQLNEIRKTSWARIICDNVNSISSIQPLAFRLPDSFNARVSCSSKAIPKLDLSPWL